METLDKPLESKTYYPRIDLYRFVFTVFVVILHFECFYPTKPKDNIFALYRSVDFFFLLSGFLLFKSLKNQKYMNALDFTLSKAKKLMPVNLVVIAAACICTSFPKVFAVKSLLVSSKALFINIVCSIPNIFFVQLFIPILEKFIPSRYEAFPMWYISAMIVSCFIWFWILSALKNKNGTDSKYYSWGLVAAVLVYSSVFNLYGKTDVAFDEIVPFFNLPAGFFRGFADIGLGIFLANYEFKIENQKLRSFLKIFFPLLLFISIFYAKYSVFDYIYIFFCAVTLVFEFSLQETPKFEKFCSFIGKISLYVYFTHAFVIFYEYTPLIQKFPELNSYFYLNIFVRILLLAATTIAAYWLSKPAGVLLNKLYAAIKLKD